MPLSLVTGTTGLLVSRAAPSRASASIDEAATLEAATHSEVPATMLAAGPNDASLAHWAQQPADECGRLLWGPSGCLLTLSML